MTRLESNVKKNYKQNFNKSCRRNERAIEISRGTDDRQTSVDGINRSHDLFHRRNQNNYGDKLQLNKT